MQLDVIHVQDVADGDSTPNSISVSTLSDDLIYGVNAYAEQQWGSASPWYIQLLMVTCTLELYKTTTVFYFTVPVEWIEAL